MGIRKNQKNLTGQEWADFIDAINKMHGTKAKKPQYRSFVQVHERAMNASDPVGMSWGVHTMGPMMRGRNFLAWHRRFVYEIELRLQKEHPNVTVPYWDAITDRQIPTPLSGAALLSSWSITRNWDPSQLASPADVALVLQLGGFSTFQTTIEGAVHAGVHNAVGGNMATASSPADPLFWLHHANLDRLWAQWQGNHPGQDPPNTTEVLKPSPLFGVKVSTVLDIGALSYSYA
jgi:Common central domain of tyrosinase